MHKTVLAFGEVLWDLLPSGPALGGAPFNFAYRASSLGDGGLMVSRLGRDELGERAWRRLEALGMDGRLIQWDEAHPTGTVRVDLSDPNRPDFHIVPDAAYDQIEPTPELLRAAASADCICYGTLIQRTPAARQTLAVVLNAGGRAAKLLDINLRKDCYTRETIVASLREADVLKLNDDEACALAGMFGVGAPELPGFCEAMIEQWDLTHCVVTLGERGAFAMSEHGERVYVPGYKVELADTCGSGDAFSAGFIHRLLRGRPLAECCELGCALGAMVATQKGATEPISPARLEAFLAAAHERTAEPGLSKYGI
jgi:fructokinase